MVHRLDSGFIQVSALNFSNYPISDRVVSEYFSPGAAVIDMFTDRRLGMVDQWRSFPVGLSPHQGMSLLIVTGMNKANRSATTAVTERPSG